jgi:hypothetical protein
MRHVICIRNLLLCAKIIIESEKKIPALNLSGFILINLEEENVYDF